MTRLPSAVRAAALTALLATGSACSEPEQKPRSETTHLYMDVHELGAGKVTADAVAKAHTADLGVQSQHGVQFLHYWVDEQRGTVYCLSRAPSAEAIVATHRQAHGLIPTTVGQVSDGE
jgi:Protein of unknown function (DUF4242)